MSVAKDIATAVASEINGATLSQTVTAAFAWVPTYDEGDQTLRVFTMIAGTQTSDNVTRIDDGGTYPVRVGILKRVDSDSDCDALDTFRQEVLNLLQLKYRLTAYPNAVIAEMSNVIYDPQELDQKRMYISDISLTYRLIT